MGLKNGGLRGSLRNIGTGVIAIRDSVVEDWEDGDFAEWSNTQNVAATSSIPLEGSFSAQVTSSMKPTDNSRPYSLAGDGLDYYPQKGDKFSVLLRESTDSDVPAFCWGVATNTNGLNGYGVYHHPNNNDYGLRRLDDGSPTGLSIVSTTLATDQTYEYEIQWHDGSGSQPDNTIEVTVYETDEAADLTSELGRTSEVSSTTAIDATYVANDGVGLSNGSSSVTGTNRIDRYWHLGSVE